MFIIFLLNLFSYISSCHSLYEVNKVQISREIFGNGLITKVPIAKDEVLLSIPISMCICSHRCGAIRGLAGQTDYASETFGDLRDCVTEEEVSMGRTWDINLALGLLMATNGESLASAGIFWDSYRSVFPSPDSLTIPFCMSTELLTELQDEDLKQNAIKQQARLSSLFPTASTESNNNSGFITALRWAFAMVRSRCFQISTDWFAMVPIIDVANHNYIPSAVFEVTGLKTNRQSSSSSSLLDGALIVNEENDPDEDLLENGICILKATRDLHQGEAVTIRYDNEVEGYSNERLMVQYGFTLPDNPVITDTLFNFLPSPPSQNNDDDDDRMSHDSNKENVKNDNVNNVHTKKELLSPLLIESLIDSVIKLQSEAAHSESITRKLEILSPLIGKQIRQQQISVTSLLGFIQEKIQSFPTTLSDDYDLLALIDDRHATDKNENNSNDSNDNITDSNNNKTSSNNSNSSSSNKTTNDDKDNDSNNNNINDDKFRACLAYRIDKKENLKLCALLLEYAIDIQNQKTLDN